MASLKNASKSAQRIHRERSQLGSRAHLGQLEKKKDYRKRAQDFQKKKETLHALHQKVLEKNPDEFYFHMVKSKLKDGVHKDLEGEKKETAQLIEDGSLRYVNHKLVLERNKVRKLGAELHLIDMEERPNTHLVFTDSKKKVKKVRRSLKDLPKVEAMTDAERKDLLISQKKAAKARSKKYLELQKRLEREAELQVVSEKLQLRKNLKDSRGQPSKRVKKGGARKSVVHKWEFQRKR